ncbi:MAG: heavy metal resistance protein CzcO, partial [Chitinophagaceae bacterium]
MKNTVLDVVIVGAGHAGLSLSYHLKQVGFKHIVFERGCIGESWKNQRWDSFRLNSMNRLNLLPGEIHEIPGMDRTNGFNAVNGIHPVNESESFPTAAEFADKLENYVSTNKLPVIENTMVISVIKDDDYGIFKIVVKDDNGLTKYFSRQLVIASGSQNEVKIPAFAKNVPGGILQLHSSQYRSAGNLPGGAVLVVGSAQSGCQVAEDLAQKGRRVYLSTSKVPRLPRRYRGRDIMDWLLSSGFFDIRTDEIKDPALFQTTAPQLTGTTGLTISLQSLAAKGVTIVGKMESVQEPNAIFQDNAAE